MQSFKHLIIILGPKVNIHVSYVPEISGLMAEFPRFSSFVTASFLLFPQNGHIAVIFSSVQYIMK